MTLPDAALSPTLPAGWHHEHRATCDSTQDLAREWVSAAAVAGSVAVFSADHQRRGRGREGRSWHDRGTGDELLASVAVRGPLPTSALHDLSVRAGEAVAAALTPPADSRLQVRSPNDLFVGERKIGGVLVDSSAIADQVQWVVVGVGVNLAGGAATVDGASTTTVEHEWGAAPGRALLLARVAVAVTDTVRALSAP